PFEYVIIDEAHHFDRVIAKQFGTVLNYVSIQHILSQMEGTNRGNWIHRFFKYQDVQTLSWNQLTWKQLIEDTQYEVDMLFRTLFSFVKKHQSRDRLSDTGRLQYVIDSSKEPSFKEKNMREMVFHTCGFLKKILRILNEISTVIQSKESTADALLAEVNQSTKDLQQVHDDLIFFFTKQEKESHIKWIEIEVQGAKNAVHLYCEKVHIAGDLQEKFFDHKKSVVLTSATLSMKNSFNYMLQTYGLKENETLTTTIDSPFNYDKQVQMNVPKDFPTVHKPEDQEAFLEATVEAILSLATVTKGRMLVLFTSYEMLRKAYYLLKEFDDPYGYTIIAQGVSSGSRSRLMKNFQASHKSILLGTRSFWEGIDIPGDHLSCIVMVRLPFQSPETPFSKAIENECQLTGEHPFYDYALPRAVLRFKQGFGRLIRKETDRGIIFMCDERIMTASYRSYFMDSIPKLSLKYDSMTALMNDAERWLDRKSVV